MKRVLARVFALTALGCLPAASIIDFNGNGLSDLWERQHNDGQLFGESFDPNADEDGDGWSNGKEAASGTDPYNGTPPDGFLTPHLAHYPSVLEDTDGDGIPDTPTTEAVTVTWPSLIGKQYTLLCSPDLTQGSWLVVDEPQMGTGTTIGKGYPITQPDGSVPEHLFWRVNVADVDTDGDGLSDHEENALGMAPGFTDVNANGLPDDWEAAHAGTFAVYPPILAATMPRKQSKPASLLLRNDTASAVNYAIAVTGANFPRYSFEDSVSGTVPYTWEDISQTGTRLAALSNIDDVFEAAPFTGFAFPFYGRNFNQLFVSSNGLLSFGTGYGSYNNQALPGTSAPSDIIAPFWDDLDTLTSGDIYYNQESDRFIVQFHEVTRHGSSDMLTFQVVLFSDGRIQFRYQTLNGDLDSCTVGVQNSTKDEGVGVVFNASYLQNGMAVEIRPDFDFLKIVPLSGSVPANSVQSLTGLFRSWTLAPAVYYANVEISDDGPGASPHQVAGRLEVENLPGTVALESPANDHTALQGQSIAFAAAASDPEGVARVEFYYGATHFAEVLTSPYEIDSDALPGGTHQITARVVDVYGQVTDSERVTIHVLHDADGDKMPDTWENLHGLDPNNSSDALADADHDGFTNLEEYNGEGDPNIPEHSDSDGIPDGIERKLIYRDSWGAWGFFNLHDPDTDQNGIPDGDEDYDKDGLTTLQEIAAGTDANKSDTDTDGVSDGKEIEFGTDPLLADAWFDNDGVPRDSDGDGLSDIFEIAHGSNPFDADTNNNGVNDGDELDWGGWPAVPGPPPPPQPPPGGGPEPGPDGPPQAPVALNPVDHQILVETKSISFPKHGFEPFQTVLPPKRFLKKTSHQRFHGGCPESGPEGVNGSLITSIYAITGESATQGDSFVNSGGEPQSAVRIGGSDDLDTYDDPPNEDYDCPGKIHYFSLLGDENTTGTMVSNALDELEDFGAGGPLLRMALDAGETLQPGTPFAFRNVHSNELTFDYQKVQFKFKWNAEQTYEQHHALTYLVVFTPENDPNTPADESANKEVVQTIEWPGQEDESPMFTIDPEQKRSGVDGSYSLLPVEIQVRNSEDGGWVAANELKVAKWEKAWISTGQFRNDFIDSGLAEIDRFRIRIKDPLPEQFRSFFISSSGSASETYNDSATEVILVEDPGVPLMGIPSDGFVSKEMILVADTADNRFMSDNNVDDQTHIVALGSDVEFRFGSATGNLVAKIPVVKKATVNVTCYILTPNGEIELELVEKAYDDIRIAREIYTQIGLEITGTVECVPIPSGVNINDGLLLDTRETRGTLSTEALAVLDTYGTPTDHTDVIGIYVDAVIFTDQAFGGECLGMAFPKGWSNAGNFKGTYLVSFEGNPITWSHELGHILLNSQGGNLSNHYNIPSNLMRETTVYTDPPTSWSHQVDTKRLTQEQKGYIFESEFIELLTQ